MRKSVTTEVFILTKIVLFAGISGLSAKGGFSLTVMR